MTTPMTTAIANLPAAGNVAIPPLATVSATGGVLDARAANECRFDYTFMPVSDMRVITEEDPKSGKKVATKVLVNDEELNPTERFWTSLFARYGFNKAFFNYFEHAEVFQRISQVEKNDRMRLCIERDASGAGTLMAVSNPEKPIVVYDELMELLTKYHGEDVQYFNGIVESTHTPRSGGNRFQVAGDEFVNRFLMATPIDGYGAPNIYLSLLRMVCMNGLVGYSKSFKSGLALGKADDDVAPSLTRALDGFGNDEGYAAIRQRIEAAAMSWASVAEAQDGLYKLLVRMHSKRAIEETQGVPMNATVINRCLQKSDGPTVDELEGTGSVILKAFHALTGDTSRLYGLANMDSLSMKRKRTLPVKCTVYDLINFATEVGTHYCTPEGSRAISAWIGGVVTEEYDMEGTKDRFGDFAEFHISAKIESGMTGDMRGTAEHRGIVKESPKALAAASTGDEE